jgi:dCTP deaminase
MNDMMVIIEGEVSKAVKLLDISKPIFNPLLANGLYQRLRRHVTPNILQEFLESSPPEYVWSQVDLRDILMAAWLYKICNSDKIGEINEYVEDSELSDRLCLKASEINYITLRRYKFIKNQREIKKTDKELGIDLSLFLGLQKGTNDSVPNKMEILSRLTEQDEKRRLDVTPLFATDQIDDGTIDLRLGNEFIVIKRTEYSALDVGEKIGIIEKKIGQYHSKYKMDFGKQFVLHPNELVLGSTFEFISLPSDLFAYVLSRSCWGRLGLLIATATAVNPGYKGCLTLELINLGEVPLILYPGLSIAQLVLHRASPGQYTGKYICPTGPEFSVVHTKWLENAFWPHIFDSSSDFEGG